jgi:hypothetical protein
MFIELFKASLLAAAAVSGAAFAQANKAPPVALSSPLGTPTSAGPTSAGPAVGPPVGEITGGRTGPGQHSPLSPFKPLVERADVLSWNALADVKTKTQGKKILPVYGESVMALNKKTQRLQGFMLPLEPGQNQRHFLLSSVPLSCSFCVPGGPESMIEVRSKTPVRYGFDVVVVEGDFAVLADDPYGLYYRLTNAVQVR